MSLIHEALKQYELAAPSAVHAGSVMAEPERSRTRWYVMLAGGLVLAGVLTFFLGGRGGGSPPGKSAIGSAPGTTAGAAAGTRSRTAAASSWPSSEDRWLNEPWVLVDSKPGERGRPAGDPKAASRARPPADAKTSSRARLEPDAGPAARGRPEPDSGPLIRTVPEPGSRPLIRTRPELGPKSTSHAGAEAGSKPLIRSTQSADATLVIRPRAETALTPAIVAVPPYAEGAAQVAAARHAAFRPARAGAEPGMPALDPAERMPRFGQPMARDGHAAAAAIAGSMKP